MKRSTLLISAALTAFLLIVLGALIGAFTQKPTTATPSDTVAPAPASNSTDPAPAGDTSAPAVAVSPEDASGAALKHAPGATVQGTPELVDFEGTVSYEVVLDQGTIYIDANSGTVLYDGTATKDAVQPAAPSRYDDDDDDDEHEEYERGEYEEDERHERSEREREHEEYERGEHEEYEHDDD
jgi:hypothetical protein